MTIITATTKVAIIYSALNYETETMPIVLTSVFHFLLRSVLRRSYYYNHFIGRDAETQRSSDLT